ncbi:PaaI family thioesterase [Pontixanthobacter aestiaquae]|uniref:PaaI family thioesterase n=1 Tax=Pontixanthobacter aestiaquae TaxID=1509367 RepID=A0A844Z7C9_9SPHN|nr:PaaI family thioesterase [Pontixanthobacter aestiaquae]MDN3645850.1 PaaI family thioesterase [Pontixanthobacter aestiaquae]MXO83156.1 PaaI family thioesterase [Pontixanthobacter aestiaquae]
MPEIPLTPYARSLGIFVHGEEDGAPVLGFEFSSDVEGRPQHLHGGATSGLLETAGYALLRKELEQLGRAHRLKPINITAQFLSAGKQKTTYAKARIVKLGRRNANISVEAWQDNRERPIATAIMNILMAEPDA